MWRICDGDLLSSAVSKQGSILQIPLRRVRSWGNAGKEVIYAEFDSYFSTRQCTPFLLKDVRTPSAFSTVGRAVKRLILPRFSGDPHVVVPAISGSDYALTRF